MSLAYKAGGVVVDLTGYTAEMVIAWPATYTKAAGSIVAGGVVLTGAITALTGAIAFHMEANAAGGTPNTTDDIPKIDDATYAVRLTAPNDCLTTILTGGIRIYPNQFESVE